VGKDPFQKYIEIFRGYGEPLSFNLAAVCESLEMIDKMREENIGGETVERRMGEYKEWDPEIFKVDKDTENTYRKRLEERGKPVVLLSEEAGRLEINPGAKGELLYAVCDPFDGSYLFKRGIPDFWYTSLAFYGEDGRPVSCVVGDAVQKTLAFADKDGAYITSLKEANLTRRFRLDAEYRKMIGRKDVTEIEKASIESYAMKPKKFLLPLVDEYRGLLEPFKFFLPNGGPYGFVDVAEGKINVYFARRQPFVDVFSGIYIAEKAAAVVTDFEGKPVSFTDDVESLHDVVVSTNPVLHEKVLQKISECISGRKG